MATTRTAETLGRLQAALAPFLPPGHVLSRDDRFADLIPEVRRRQV
jgi:hypothetical protein